MLQGKKFFTQSSSYPFQECRRPLDSILACFRAVLCSALIVVSCDIWGRCLTMVARLRWIHRLQVRRNKWLIIDDASHSGAATRRFLSPQQLVVATGHKLRK